MLYLLYKIDETELPILEPIKEVDEVDDLNLSNNKVDLSKINNYKMFHVEHGNIKSV